MALPPVAVRIKRKRTDEPVDLLHIHQPLDKKQRRATDFVFFRQPNIDVVSSVNFLEHRLDPIHKVLPVPVSRADSSNFLPVKPPEGQNGVHSTTGLSQLPTSTSKALKVSQPRCFHISRAATASASLVPPPSPFTRNRKDTIFVERKSRTVFKSSTITSVARSSSPVQSYPIHVQKKPGLSSRSSVSASKVSPNPAPFRNVRLPSGLSVPWDVNSESLVAEMQAYTLSEISKNIATSEAERPLYNATKAPTTHPEKPLSCFRPRKSVHRYKERHPDHMNLDSDIEIEYVDEPDAEDEDADWIVDTYIRMPVEALDSAAETQTNVGLLVLDSQEEVEEFYRDHIESDDEEDEDEDENAENHYTADYPDEEVASDDEFDRNAYCYTKDFAEFEPDFFNEHEEDDVTRVDSRFPWLRKPLFEQTEEFSGIEDDDS